MTTPFAPTPDPAPISWPPPRSSGAGKTFALVVAMLGALGGGGYAYYLNGKLSESGASLRATQAARDEEAKKRAGLEQSLAGCEKATAEQTQAAASASANLTATQGELEELRKQRAEVEARLATFKALTEKFRKMIDSGKLQVVLRHGQMIVKLPASVLFTSGSAELSTEGKPALAEVASVLKQVTDRRFLVAGHTDNVPLGRSPYRNNWELSAYRALTVTQHLISSGMAPSKLVAAGYAEFEPVRENSSEAGRRENRRIEIVLLPNLAELPLLPSTSSAPSAAPSSGAAAAAAPPVSPSAETKPRPASSE